MSDYVASFDSSQQSLIELLGAKTSKILEGISKSPLNHGEPPFIVELDQRTLFVLHGDGQLLRLPPDFNLPDEMLDDGEVVIYTLPVPDLGVLRFLPLEAGINLDKPYEGNAGNDVFNAPFLSALDQLLEMMHANTLQFAKAKMAEKLVRLQPTMREVASETEMDLEELLSQKGTKEQFIALITQIYADAAQRTGEILLDVYRNRDD